MDYTPSCLLWQAKQEASNDFLKTKQNWKPILTTQSREGSFTKIKDHKLKTQQKTNKNTKQKTHKNLNKTNKKKSKKKRALVQIYQFLNLLSSSLTPFSFKKTKQTTKF